MKSNLSKNRLEILPTARDISLLRSKLIRWFTKHNQDYPWRKTGDPFRLLIAEMMLRRTKADQVKSVYHRLFERYPDATTLAEAPKQDIEQTLYPLGLKWRTPAFQLLAREIKEKYNGRVPETRDELQSLPGVGEYVAGAVLSIGYGKNEWIVDSNVVRLWKRYFGIQTSKEGRRDRHVVETAKIYASGKNPRKANLAILDFAALVCTPNNPKHEECPLRKDCHHYLAESQEHKP